MTIEDANNKDKEKQMSGTINLNITGMTCSHCVIHVTKAL